MGVLPSTVWKGIEHQTNEEDREEPQLIGVCDSRSLRKKYRARGDEIGQASEFTCLNILTSELTEI